MRAPIVPEPCPLDLELRLEPGGRLVYVSDLHLTDTGPADDFGATDELCELLASLHDHPGQVLLALGGDILDLLQVEGPKEDRVARALEGPVAARVGDALQRLAARPGVTVLYLVGNVRPGLLVPWWLVSNFFYKFMGRALRDFALPLVLLTIALNLVVGLLVGDLGRIAYLGNRAVRWVSSFVLTNLALLAVLSTFLGRSFRRAAAAHGLPSPDEATEEAAIPQGDLPELLERRDPDATVLITGHTHEPRVVRLPGGRVAVDGGCWVRGLVPVRAWLSLPPVFVPTYPVNWVEVQATGEGVVVALWERRLAVRRRLGRIERLVARRALPPAHAAPPAGHKVRARGRPPRRQRAPPLGRPPPVGVRANATRLPFRDACVDAVLEVH